MPETTTIVPDSDDDDPWRSVGAPRFHPQIGELRERPVVDLVAEADRETRKKYRERLLFGVVISVECIILWWIW